MQADLDTLKKQVLDTTRTSPVGKNVEAVDLESDSDNEGTNFLRVILHIKDGGKAEDSDLLALIEAIEDAVGAIDERYPSVRFADAA
jgi:hypothetical protein